MFVLEEKSAATILSAGKKRELVCVCVCLCVMDEQRGIHRQTNRDKRTERQPLGPDRGTETQTQRLQTHRDRGGG